MEKLSPTDELPLLNMHRPSKQDLQRMLECCNNWNVRIK